MGGGSRYVASGYLYPMQKNKFRGDVAAVCTPHHDDGAGAPAEDAFRAAPRAEDHLPVSMCSA